MWVQLNDLIRCKDLIILQMGQINFIRGLMSENLSLGAQFELNWEDWIFRRPNLFLQSQLVQIRDQNVRKSKFLGQLMAKLKKFTANDHFAKDVKLWGPNWLKSGVKLKRIKSLMVN
jgi:hypothetical protein